MIEILVVVALVGIGASLGVASPRPVVGDVRLHGTARASAALIRSARLHAMARHERVSVVASPTQIQVLACPARFGVVGCANGGALTAIPNQSIGLGSDEATGVSLVSGPATDLVFGPNGLPEGAPQLRTFVLKNDIRTRTIEVTPAGEVVVQ